MLFCLIVFSVGMIESSLVGIYLYRHLVENFSLDYNDFFFFLMAGLTRYYIAHYKWRHSQNNSIPMARIRTRKADYRPDNAVRRRIHCARFYSDRSPLCYRSPVRDQIDI